MAKAVRNMSEKLGQYRSNSVYTDGTRPMSSPASFPMHTNMASSYFYKILVKLINKIVINQVIS